MTVGFQPSGDNVLVRLVPADSPGQADEAVWAQLLAVGPGRRTADGALVAPDLNPGDRVALRPGRAVPLRIHDEAFAVVSAADVLGVLLSATGVQRPYVPVAAAGPVTPQAGAAENADHELETNVAPDDLDREASTGEDLH